MELRQLGENTFVLIFYIKESKFPFVLVIEQRQFKKLLTDYLWKEIAEGHFEFLGSLD